MAGQAKKSTKKFEKNRLKDTLEKRKEVAKIKQRAQVKAKKKARNAKDNAPASSHNENSAVERPRKVPEDNFNEMSVDQFFQGGFELPQPKKSNSKAQAHTGKRKRDPESARAESLEGSSGADGQLFSDEEASTGAENGAENHQEDLDALAEKDPDFYKYLQENDAELLEFEGGDLAEIDKLSEDEKPKKKRKKDQEAAAEDADVLNEDAEDENGQIEVTMAMVSKWKTAMTEQNSLRAMRQVVLAFRSAAYVNASEEKELRYSISSPDVYHQLLMLALEHVPSVLHHHVPAKESTTGKVRVATECKKFRTLAPLLKSHSAAVLHLLENLSDVSTLKKTLDSLVPLLPYLLSFKKVLKSLVKSTVDIWSDASTTDSARITAFLVIRRLAVISDASIREAVLRTTYLGLVKGSRVTNPHTLQAINLMKNSAAELWGIDPAIGYTTGFVYIRQLAVHLRASITQPTKDSYKQIYNWQYVHSLDFWSRVISTHCSPNSNNPSLKTPSDSPLHPLLYPLVQITLGALRLIPTPTYYPLRFHLARSLLRLSRATTTYIPLAPSLLEVLHSAEMTKPPKPSTLKPLDFSTALRVPKPYLRTRTYQDGLGEQLVELVAEFFGVWAKHIAFPELVLPPIVQLKRWVKSTSSSSSHKDTNGTNPNKNNKTKNHHGATNNPRLTSAISLLTHKLEHNARYIEQHRRNVDFGPSNRGGVEAFLRDVKVEEDTPLGAFLEGLRRKGEERQRLLQRAREGERERREMGRGEEMEGEEDEEDDE
ncbi:MAG: hypothetical protein LQ338_000816 [Usnochroma carphineum]|nr:MAG: hypothetical protein LQ338_000816 [Usnochroma carphineum]